MDSKILKKVRDLPALGVEYDIDLSSATKEEILELGNRIPIDNVVLVRNYNLSESDIINVCSTIGQMSKPSMFCMHPDYPGLFRVTNERQDGKKIGVFADGELDWHSNGNGRPTGKESCVALYCVKPGINSITSVCDMRSAYNDLPENIKNLVNNVQGLYKFKNNTFYDFDEDDELLTVFEGHSDDVGVVKPLVFNHPWTKEKVLYFAFHTIREMWIKDIDHPLNQEWLKEYLLDHILQEKYIYHHDDWTTGDFLFMDQFHSIHKRNAVEGERFLYRTCFDYSNINFF